MQREPWGFAFYMEEVQEASYYRENDRHKKIWWVIRISGTCVDCLTKILGHKSPGI